MRQAELQDVGFRWTKPTWERTGDRTWVLIVPSRFAGTDEGGEQQTLNSTSPSGCTRFSSLTGLGSINFTNYKSSEFSKAHNGVEHCECLEPIMRTDDLKPLWIVYDS